MSTKKGKAKPNLELTVYCPYCNRRYTVILKQSAFLELKESKEEQHEAMSDLEKMVEEHAEFIKQWNKAVLEGKIIPVWGKEINSILEDETTSNMATKKM